MGVDYDWSKKYEEIKTQFPSVEKLNWHEALKDGEMFSRLIKDIIKIGASSDQKRPGPRSNPTSRESANEFRKILHEDYSEFAFPVAFAALAGSRSIRSIASKVNISKSTVHRLLTGELKPDVYIMTEIAKAFKKHPSYFVEYREMAIAGAILTKIKNNPEASYHLYKRLVSDGNL